MKLIAHRGNTHGPKPELENSPAYILDAMWHYDVEIDVWYIGDMYEAKLPRWGWYLGHDKPTHWVPRAFLQMPGLWVHLKNKEALRELIKGQHDIKNYFWHENDQVSHTSGGYIWTCDATDWAAGTVERTVLMKADAYPDDLHDLQGDHYFATLCSDFVGAVKPRCGRRGGGPR